MAKTVVVVGGGVGGLSAAIHLRLHGHHVHLLEAHVLGGKAAGLEIAGYKLDPGPSIVILVRFYKELFRQAGRRMEDYLSFQRLDPLTRVYFEGSSGFLDLPSDRASCVGLVKSLDSADGTAFERLLDKLHEIAPHIEESVFKREISKPWELLNPHLIRVGLRFNSKLTYKQFIDQEFRSPILRAFFYGFPSYGGQSYHGKGLGALLIPYYMLHEGVFYPEGGVAAIPLALTKLAKELGVEITKGVRAESLQVTGGPVQAVLKTGEVISCDAIVSNVDRLTTGAMLGNPSSAKPSYSYFTAHWGLKRELKGLSHHTLLVPKDFEKGFEDLYERRHFPTSPIVYLNATSATDPEVAPPGHTNLFAVVSSPAVEQHLDWTDLAEHAKVSVRRSLDNFGLGFEDDEIVFERIQTPLYFQLEHGNYLGSLYGPDESQRLFGGLFPLPCTDEKHRNLFYCGGSVQPGAGLPMVTLSGKFAAQACDRYLKRL